MATVKTVHGVLKGSEAERIHSFKGIPYAAPISGENRWLPPQPPQSWSGERDATKFGKIPLQMAWPVPMWMLGRAGRMYCQMFSEEEPEGDDCLNLNVWTPTLDAEAKLPVMYWITGGAFVLGSGSMSVYDGKRLAQKGVVVVTINYRVGLAGTFAATDAFNGDDFCIPNRCFLDQVAGLRWVNENIKGFGGDPDNVTIFGQSAGGTSVSVLMASPLTKGLFQRAIVQSGAPESGHSLSDRNRFAEDFLQTIGIKKGDNAAMSELTPRQTSKFLKTADKLIRKNRKKEKYGQLHRIGINDPVVFDTEFLPEGILESLKQGQAKNIDLMIGSVAQEGKMFSLTIPGPGRLATWVSLRLSSALLEPRNDIKQAMGRYKKIMPEASNLSIREQILNDIMIRRGGLRVAEAHSLSNPGRTFLYQFDWASPVMNGAIGTPHGIEVPFVTQNLEPMADLLGDIGAISELADTISDIWVNFAKTGTPASPNLPVWEPFDTGKRATMVLNTSSEIRYDLDGERRKIWGNDKG